jgi:manganese/zinc/iron transport system substrate-binding protein
MIIYRYFAALLLLSGLCACSSPSENYRDDWMSSNGKIKVLCTIAMIEDLVHQIGGEWVDTSTLIKKGLNPHTYQLVKGDNEKFLRADLVFYNGLGLEHGPSTISYLIHHDKCIGLGDLLYKTDPNLIITLNGELDPHIWLDASLWSKTIPLITSYLSELDPLHAPEFKKNAQALEEQLNLVHQQIKKQMQSIPKAKRYLITSHDAFNYFSRAYLAEPEEQGNDRWRQRFASPEGLSPESQLGIKHIQEIIDYLKQHQVHVLFTESNISRDSIKKIAEAAQTNGLQVIIAREPLFSDDMGEPGTPADTYVKMLQYNAAMMASYLNLN